jgi:hypothetical protein
MDTEQDSPAFASRKLLRAARRATLATQTDGQPFAGLVTPAMTAGLDMLLLLSDLSEHTRHLRADGRCAVMVTGEAAETNPQTAPRVTLLGRAAIDDAPALRARFLAVHPYAALYADFGDFHLWRIAPDRASYVGGFARAHRLPAAELLPDAAAVAAVSTAADDIRAHCNDHHADALARLAARGGEWRMVGVDVDGCDLAQGETVLRVAWPAPVADADGVRRALILLGKGK